MPRSQTARTESLTHTIVEKVASREGVEPIELPPLHGAIDPEALDAVFAETEGGNARDVRRVEFSYLRYNVIVHGDRQVDVEATGTE